MCRDNMQLLVSFRENFLSFRADFFDFLWDNENTSTPQSLLVVEVLCLNHIFSDPEHSEWIYLSAFVK